jgi:hypothetical protein
MARRVDGREKKNQVFLLFQKVSDRKKRMKTFLIVSAVIVIPAIGIIGIVRLMFWRWQ